MAIRLDEVQGGVLCGYGFPQAAHLFCRIDDPEAARAWLRTLPVTSAVSWGTTPPAAAVNVALSAAGLAALGTPGADELPPEVRAGMAGRAGRLRDGPADGPEHWQPGLDDRSAHVVLSVHARDAAPAALAEAIAAVAPPTGVAVLHDQRCAVLPGGREHFGWSDGLAQPSVADPVAGPWDGQGTPPRGRRRARVGEWEPVAPGEFLLGYEDEDGEVPAAPGPLGAGTTYMVVRKLEQHVAAWERQLLRWARGDAAEAERIAARVVGRWKDGSPVATHPDAPAGLDGAPGDRPARAARFAALNDFRFAGDPDGRRCPVGAHVRRANPRDALGDGRLARRHRLLRRGMPYGPEATAEERVDDAASPERGLLFVCFQASVARQFELVQGDWLADGDAFGLGEQHDALMSPGAPEGRMLAGGRLLARHERTVSLRGGGYFAVPSLPGLQAL